MINEPGTEDNKWNEIKGETLFYESYETFIKTAVHIPVDHEHRKNKCKSPLTQ